MALQRSITPAISLFTLLPGICLVPVVLVLFRDLHGGGLPLIGQFLVAAVQPSLDASLLESLWRGMQITLLTAVLSWSLSSLIGVLLGALSSRSLWLILVGNGRPASVIRRVLSPIRSVHELIWGLLLLQLFGLNGWVAVLAIVLPYSALMARVVADQIDSHESAALPAVMGTGASAAATVLTAVCPSVMQPLKNHIGHRLDCALRSAVLLGVFGLGGIGTDLMLSLQSLQFNELWSGLWFLAALMTILDRLVRRIPSSRLVVLLPLLAPVGSLFWGNALNHDLAWPAAMLIPGPWDLGDGIAAALNALNEVQWISIIGSTLILTLLAAGIAIALPPMLLLLWPSETGRRVQLVLWYALRLIPPPLSALLLLLICKPSLPLAAFALGLHHSGVMGRVFADDLNQQGSTATDTLALSGATTRIGWLYGPLTQISRSYLAYATYRCDVILRDTAVVGLVGGAGLGWQLIEALSSFHWWLVAWLVLVFSLLTLAGEVLSEHGQKRLNCKAVVL
jgi:phosphonate transport system permease protein